MGDFHSQEVVSATLADGSSVFGSVVSVQLEVEGRKCCHNLIVTKLSSDKVIIGRDLIIYFDISKKLNNLYFSKERDYMN